MACFRKLKCFEKVEIKKWNELQRVGVLRINTRELKRAESKADSLTKKNQTYSTESNQSFEVSTRVQWQQSVAHLTNYYNLTWLWMPCCLLVRV